MPPRSILITGCSSGIGYDAANALHQRGWRVFATCRSEDDCARLRDEGLESFPLDLASESSLDSAVSETLSRTGGTLDALFNNGARVAQLCDRRLQHLLLFGLDA
ncbi:putative 2,4-dienoyl-CoA reductase [mine drainage metagenome]|uniref:Putative 2,4-dienoyl-CoA reductase n=1 Tax=mine drainage metagenome TaxID=410659 RepID=A0A1J5PMG5_9ZZZZ